MIRTKHDIDTKLVDLFISERNFNDEINELLLDWYGALGDKDHQNTRNRAIAFLKKMASAILSEINYPVKEREELIETFEPLELLLRTALSLRSEEGPHNVRDHLSHTVRNVLFTNYILKRYRPENNSDLRKQLFICAIFHDIAYPIEQLKKVAHKLEHATFKELLNSKGNIEIELDDPDDLLEMLNYFGELKSELDKKIKKSEDENQPNQSIKNTSSKLSHVYREIISKSIAGKGLFDSSHSISSVVLFLMPIVKYWRDSKVYHDMNLDKICDICLSMTYHDRVNPISDIQTFTAPLILRIMRISDELQEWDRESNSYIKDVKILTDEAAIISMQIVLRDKGDEAPCKPELFIVDKIKGLLGAVENETIKININLEKNMPVERSIVSETLAMKLKEKGVETNFKLNGSHSGRAVELSFHNKHANILIK